MARSESSPEMAYSQEQGGPVDQVLSGRLQA